MELAVLVSGGFALAGVVAGSVLTPALGARFSRQRAREGRLNDALRSVGVAITAQDFIWSVGGAGAPPDLSPARRRAAEHDAYLKGVDRYFTALQDARRDVARLSADGLPVGDSWKTNALFVEELSRLYDLLLEQSTPRR